VHSEEEGLASLEVDVAVFQIDEPFPQRLHLGSGEGDAGLGDQTARLLDGYGRGGWWGAAGTLAVVVASLAYAIGSLWAQRLVTRTDALPLATASMIGGAIVLLPLGLAQLPSQVPGWKETGSVLALAVLGTAIAQIILYRVLRTDGAARVSLVTYLLPATALFYGVALLGEPLTVEELVGMVLILGGVAFGTGAVRLPRRAPAPATPSP